VLGRPGVGKVGHDYVDAFDLQVEIAAAGEVEQDAAARRLAGFEIDPSNSTMASGWSRFSCAP